MRRNDDMSDNDARLGDKIMICTYKILPNTPTVGARDTTH